VRLDDLVDLLHQPHRFPERHHDPLVMLDILLSEGAARRIPAAIRRAR
jgi:hypothetical protein